ncbi:hypothetical protein MRX96_036841 [Rhipicephalus microplus]
MEPDEDRNFPAVTVRAQVAVKRVREIRPVLDRDRKCNLRHATPRRLRASDVVRMTVSRTQGQPLSFEPSRPRTSRKKLAHSCTETTNARGRRKQGKLDSQALKRNVANAEATLRRAPHVSNREQRFRKGDRLALALFRHAQQRLFEVAGRR